MKKSALFFIVPLVALLALVVLALLPMVTVEAPSLAEHSFELSESMPRARKILVRTNAVKKIVAMANAELLDQSWLQMQFEMERPILRRDWHLDGTGELKVRINDAYLGQHDITLNQSVDITPERLHATNDLVQPAGPIREYNSTLTLTPTANGKAWFTTTLSLKITTKASWLTRRIVDREIRKAADKALQKQEQAIRELIGQHADEIIILPEKTETSGLSKQKSGVRILLASPS